MQKGRQWLRLYECYGKQKPLIIAAPIGVLREAEIHVIAALISVLREAERVGMLILADLLEFLADLLEFLADLLVFLADLLGAEREVMAAVALL